jgi:hypothetical protein
MDSSRNFRSIPVIIFVNNLHLVLLIDFEKRLKSFTLQTKCVPGLLDAEEFSFFILVSLQFDYLHAVGQARCSL